MKDKYIRIKLTEEENKELMEMANTLDISIGDFVKYCCLSKVEKREVVFFSRSPLKCKRKNIKL